MGLWSWLFPSPADRIASARRALAAGRPDHARLDLDGLTGDEVEALRHEAENRLALLNLDAAVQYARLGDEAKSVEHLALAEEFHHGGHEEAFRRTRRELREVRAEQESEAGRREAEKKARMLAVDPLGAAGGPSFLDPTLADADLDEEAEELAQRLALVIESYPPDLRDRARALDPAFAKAALDLEEGRADLAWTALQALPAEPLVCWERARAAARLGDRASAIAALRDLAERAGGHRAMGADHSAVFLARLLVEADDPAAALRVLRELAAREPKVPPAGAFLLGQLLAATGELAQAERLLVGLVREHPKEQALYATLARVRLQGGHRAMAMQALEASITACGCDSPGKCGSRPPDLDVHRMLATLYLEDGTDAARGLELARTAAALVDRPGWEDAYLSALVARQTGNPEARTIAERLARATPPGTPAAERVGRLLVAAGAAR